jgi:hypothetical protein
MNLDVTADDSCLDPHVSCVKTSHPATQLDVNPEQRSIRQSMMSGPHHGDSAHTYTTFGTSGKFIRASLSTGEAWLSAIRHRPSRSAPAPLPASRDDHAPTPNAAYRATRSIPSPLPVLMGLRWGEAAALQVADLDFLRRRIALHEWPQPFGGVTGVRGRRARSDMCRQGSRRIDLACAARRLLGATHQT